MEKQNYKEKPINQNNKRLIFLLEEEFENSNNKVKCDFSCQLNVFSLNLAFYSNSLKLIIFLKRIYSLFSEAAVIQAFDSQNTKNIKIYLIDYGKEGHKYFNLGELFGALEAFLAKQTLDKFLFFHGASVMFNDTYVILLGDSGIGKTTIASFLRDREVKILSDDVAVLDYKRNRVLPYPAFSNIRSKTYTNLQLKYKDFFSYYIDKFGACGRGIFYSVSEQEFQKYYSYQREFYDLNSVFSLNSANIAFVFLERKHTKKTTLAKMPHSQSVYKYLDSVKVKSGFLRSKLKDILDCFGKVSFYSLELGDSKVAADLLIKDFS